MPELPEVETIVRQLNRKIVGWKIRSIRLLRSSILEPGSIKRFGRVLKGCLVEEVRRRGKYILIGFSKGHTLAVHLRMTGKFIVTEGESVKSKHTRMIVDFDRGMRLYYDDQRALGRLTLLRPGYTLEAIKLLGPEPVEPDFTVGTLKERLSSIDRQLKDALMDQKIIAGIGNIYASEICFRACIHPFKRTTQLGLGELRVLHGSIVKTLKQAIALQGTTFSNYRDVENAAGKFQNFLKVYRKEGEPCSKCATPIKKVKQKQRSTYFCPVCQSL